MSWWKRRAASVPTRGPCTPNFSGEEAGAPFAREQLGVALEAAEDLLQPQAAGLQVAQRGAGLALGPGAVGRALLRGPVDGGDGGDGAERGQCRQHGREGIGREPGLALARRRPALGLLLRRDCPPAPLENRLRIAPPLGADLTPFRKPRSPPRRHKGRDATRLCMLQCADPLPALPTRGDGRQAPSGCMRFAARRRGPGRAAPARSAARALPALGACAALGPADGHRIPKPRPPPPRAPSSRPRPRCEAERESLGMGKKGGDKFLAFVP